MMKPTSNTSVFDQAYTVRPISLVHFYTVEIKIDETFSSCSTNIGRKPEFDSKVSTA